MPSNQWGPDVSSTYPLGYFIEDYEYVSGLGLLDQYNGRMTVTPEYPNGTYAYFTTIDALGNNAYPYVVGPNYYGIVDTSDYTGSVAIPGMAVKYTQGDFDLSTGVDAADYVLWRKQPGTQSDYVTWRSHFGSTASAAELPGANVPEPGTIYMLLMLVGLSSPWLRLRRS